MPKQNLWEKHRCYETPVVSFSHLPILLPFLKSLCGGMMVWCKAGKVDILILEDLDYLGGSFFIRVYL